MILIFENNFLKKKKKEKKKREKQSNINITERKMELQVNVQKPSPMDGPIWETVKQTYIIFKEKLFYLFIYL